MDLKRDRRCIRRIQWAALLAMLATAMLSTVHAIPVTDLREFAPLHGRYAPAGDCARAPRIVVDGAGFAFEGGPTLPKATAPEFAAGWFGARYEGIAHVFLPYAEEPRPLVLTFNAGEQPGRLAVEAGDFGYPGGPVLPERYRPYVAASPYMKCR